MSLSGFAAAASFRASLVAEDAPSLTSPVITNLLDDTMSTHAHAILSRQIITPNITSLKLFDLSLVLLSGAILSSETVLSEGVSPGIAISAMITVLYWGGRALGPRLFQFLTRPTTQSRNQLFLRVTR